MVVYQYYTLKMRKRKGENLQISSTMVFFPLYFIMDSGYTNEVSVYKLYLLGVNLSVIGRVLGQAFLRTTSPSRLRRATSPGRGGFGSLRKVNGFARGSPTRGNGDDRRQRRKQGGAVGAAASRMQAAAKQTLGAATRAPSCHIRIASAFIQKHKVTCLESRYKAVPVFSLLRHIGDAPVHWHEETFSSGGILLSEENARQYQY